MYVYTNNICINIWIHSLPIFHGGQTAVNARYMVLKLKCAIEFYYVQTLGLQLTWWRIVGWSYFWLVIFKQNSGLHELGIGPDFSTLSLDMEIGITYLIRYSYFLINILIWQTWVHPNNVQLGTFKLSIWKKNLLGFLIWCTAEVNIKVSLTYPEGPKQH